SAGKPRLEAAAVAVAPFRNERRSSFLLIGLPFLSIFFLALIHYCLMQRALQIRPWKCDIEDFDPMLQGF
ncbi:MAG: hypothetical protein L7U49_01780, partial [Litoricolaceae bacterium]|nr:hypothetical protein [Litorivicinaceae bacterium]